ncbi:HNH endonuclease signature motif containing protein, partial [Arthrobacter pascens]
MEAIGEDAADRTAGRAVTPGLSAAALLGSRRLRSVPVSASGGHRSASDGGGSVVLRQCLALLESAVDSAPGELALAGFREAADFADGAEEISRRVEQLQLLGAAAVDRTRTEAINAADPASKATGWTTGWGNEPAAPVPGTEPGPDDGSGTSAAPDAGAGATPETAAGADTAAAASLPAAPTVQVPAPAFDPADDGCRNTAEFLRVRLRISIGEARPRLALAGAVLPRAGITGAPMPPACEPTAAALAAGTIASRAGTIITTALDKARPIAEPAVLEQIETILVHTAVENDHDFLTRIAHRWADAIDQDGTEPSEEELRHRQGAFLRRPRRGLHHLEIFATTDQYEHLLTVMNTATNPRTTTPNTTNSTNTTNSGNDSSGPGNRGDGGAAANLDAVFNTATPDPDLDRRTVPQQRLDGLVGGCKAALAAGTLPTTGGLRPQVMVTISYQDLLKQLQTAAATGPRYPRTTPTTPTARSATSQTHHDTSRGAAPAAATTDQPTVPGTGEFPGTATGTDPDTATVNGLHQPPHPGTESGQPPLPGPEPGASPGTATGSGTFTFTGPVTASTVRKIACDADIIPVLLGSEGRILDIGRTTRIFPPHIRKALTARDQCCAFPNCTIPAPWCEAHHTTYWSHGGTTGTDNGTLLCSHHHH